MPGPLLHVGATVFCKHFGTATPATSNPSVVVGGQQTIVITTRYDIASCPNAPGGTSVPCKTGTWTAAATRVTSKGQPLVLIDSSSICVPNGTPLMPDSAQTRVTGI